MPRNTRYNPTPAEREAQRRGVDTQVRRPERMPMPSIWDEVDMMAGRREWFEVVPPLDSWNAQTQASCGVSAATRSMTATEVMLRARELREILDREALRIVRLDPRAHVLNTEARNYYDEFVDSMRPKPAPGPAAIQPDGSIRNLFADPAHV